MSKKRAYILHRRKRPLSRGTLYQVYTMENWTKDGSCSFSTMDYGAACAFMQGSPVTDYTTMPGARAAIVRPVGRYL